MALPATDTFTGTTGTNLGAYSANWVANNTAAAILINTNAITTGTSGGGENAYRWGADTFAADQYSQITFTTSANTLIFIGPAVRISSSAKTYYGYYTSSVNAQFVKLVAGVWTQFGSDLSATPAGGLMRIEAEGTTIRCLANGIQQASVTDTSIATGSAGLLAWSDSLAGTNRWDNWQGGNLAGAVAALKFSDAARAAMLNAIETTVGTSPILRIRTGLPPATVATADAGTVLAEMTLPSDWMAAATIGSKSMLGAWSDASANASGTAGHFRIYSSGGTAHLQGTITVTGGGGDMTISSTSITSGQTVTVTSFVLNDNG